jgi:DNA (cytosine-5)-methyltransferase 1
LTLTYSHIINHADVIRVRHGKPPVICIYENVPGLLSDRTGAFGCLLAGLSGEGCELVPPGKRWTNAGAVFGPKRAVAWRTVDAQFFGLAQRRRRVFVVASARDKFDPCSILFEWESMRRDTAPRREKGQGASVGVEFGPKDHGADATDDLAPTLRAMNHSGSHANAGGQMAVAFQSSQSGVRIGEAHATLDAHNGSRRHNGVASPTAGVRRLTPRECERLQGFPDDYTNVPHRGKPAADGPRYKALGNSWAVPCVRWIASRLALQMQGAT